VPSYALLSLSNLKQWFGATIRQKGYFFCNQPQWLTVKKEKNQQVIAIK
jgi:hypothetical protein